MIPLIWVLLGRTGDLISVLPLLREEAQAGRRPTLMVAKEFLGVMTGVSYCDVVPFDGAFDDLDGAVAKAKEIAVEVKCVQVTGPPDAVKRLTYDPTNTDSAKTDCFQKEVWRFMGRFDRWKDQPPLMFDGRDPEREVALLNSIVRPAKKKILLVALGGNNAPFPYPDLCFELLRLKFPKMHIIDLSKIKAKQVYDLLGLYEMAHCLVACDSAPLHLAYALVKTLPVVALINDKPSLWHGSAWRANHIAHIRYTDFPKAAVEMLDAIENIGKPGSPFDPSLSTPKIVHVWSCYEISSENEERTANAADLWYEQSNVVACPVEVGSVGQDSANVLKDDKRFPMVRDVIRKACYRAEPDDVICLTRCDTSPTPGLAERILSGPLPAYAHRTIRNGDGDTFHPAVDLFAFTRAWWDAHGSEMPPMVLAMDTYWNRVLLDVVKKHGAHELPFAIHREPGTPAAVSPVATKRLLHNENEALKWWQKNGSKIEPEPATQQTSEGWMVNRHALLQYGYNPSIIRVGDRLLMAYRWHPEHESRTRLAVAELDATFGVMVNKQIQVEAKSAEDPRLFIFGGALWICYVDSTFPDRDPKCITRYGRLREYENHWAVEDIYQPMIGKNDGSSLEKNFVPFAFEDKLLCIYQTHGEQIVHVLEGDKSVLTHRALGPRWPYGPMRGGTVPLPYKGKFLRFFHSGLDNEPPPWRRRYYVGAMLMEPTPPFQTVAISSEPILRGSERDELSDVERQGCQQYKAKVVFPCGVLAYEKDWLLSIGVNDSACALVKITEDDLHL